MNALNEFEACRAEREAQIACIHRLRECAAQSLRRVVEVSDRQVIRSLYREEVDALQHHCGCHCSDWTQTRLVLSKDERSVDQSVRLRREVSKTAFDGMVVLILDRPSLRPTTSDYAKLPLGIHNNALVSNSILSLGARVYGNGLVCDTFVGSGAILLRCGSISCKTSRNYQDLTVTVGPESGGGRKIRLLCEATMIEVGHQLKHPSADLRDTVSDSPDKIGFRFNVVSSECIVRETPTIDGIYLYPAARLDAATNVSNAVLFSGASICNASAVSDCILQWDCTVTDHSIVTSTFLMEQVVAGPKAIVASSVMGPDVHVSAGEVHASVLGPNTNAHHQSLLISVLWPLGRGNVGYGANVGSNHTGRIPDQETVAGEGVFWGLSTVITFPVDLSFAPYSIIAAGTTLGPQRVCMPFSLIASNPYGGPNNISPGWVLKSSPYAIMRSEKKFSIRRKAKRHSYYTGWKIIRPELIDLCLSARSMLRYGLDAQSSNQSEKSISGIGDSKLNEKSRLSGIKAYTECIHRFILSGLVSFLFDATSDGAPVVETVVSMAGEVMAGSRKSSLDKSIGDVPRWGEFPWETDVSSLWKYQRALLLNEFPFSTTVPESWIRDRVEAFLLLEQQHATAVFQCKNRDDVRGLQIIPGYETSHDAAEKDSIVADVREDLVLTEANVASLLERLDEQQRSKL
jgi:hypothetical protein